MEPMEKEATSLLVRLEEMIRQREDRAKRLPFFDASLWLGSPEGFPLATEYSLEQLQAAMEGVGIRGGLVSHWYGKTLSAQDGNRAVVEALEKARRDLELFAVWTALPLFPAEPGPLPGQEGLSLPAWVRAVRLFPRSHHFPLTPWCVGPLCEWLRARRMPLFIWHTELEWPSLYELARTFPQLPLVVETQTQKILYHTRPLFALLRDCPNVYVELSNFAGPGYLEYGVRELGPERWLFGSFLPVSDPLVPLGLVIDADLPESAQRLIAGENLRRLLAEVSH